MSIGCRGGERGNGSGLTSFRSFRLVSITMVAAFCSQTMRQKSLTVSCLGPGDRGQGPIEMDGGSSRDLTQPCRPPVPSPPVPGPCDYSHSLAPGLMRVLGLCRRWDKRHCGAQLCFPASGFSGDQLPHCSVPLSKKHLGKM